jgi:phosphopantetheinyl transferase (holo-ACP synthase)
VIRSEAGAPSIELHGRGSALLESRGASVIHVSLTHVKEYAAAFAVLER